MTTAKTTETTATKKTTSRTTKPTEEATKVEVTKAKPKTRAKKKQIDLSELVPCRNITSGMLIYKSTKTGLEATWSEYGDEEYLEVSELLTMKTSQPKFLKEPWLLVDDEEVADYLGLTKMYANLIPVDELDYFFEKDAKEIAEILPLLPKGSRELVADKARKLIEANELDSTKVIRLLEQELKVDLFSLMD
jgi:hypothetical protein